MLGGGLCCHFLYGRTRRRALTRYASSHGRRARDSAWSGPPFGYRQRSWLRPPFGNWQRSRRRRGQSASTNWLGFRQLLLRGAPSYLVARRGLWSRLRWRSEGAISWLQRAGSSAYRRRPGGRCCCYVDALLRRPLGRGLWRRALHRAHYGLLICSAAALRSTWRLFASGWSVATWH